MFNRSSSLIGAIMMMVVSVLLTQTSTDANEQGVKSVFQTNFVEEDPVLTRNGAARLATQEAASAKPPIRIISIKGGSVAIGGGGTLPVIQNRKTVVGIAEDRLGRQVHFKVVRGDPVPPAEQATATFPDEMSVCFTDADGNSMFRIAVGAPVGDVIPECGDDEHGSGDTAGAASGALPTVQEQEHRMMATIKTMGTISKLEFAPDFGEEFRALTVAQRFLRKVHKPKKIVASDSVIILDETGSPVTQGTTMAQANSVFASRTAGSSNLASPQVFWMRGRRHVVELHAAPIHGFANLVEHSATYTALYEENPAPFGRFYNVYTNCNHGRCPWEMTFRYLMFSEPRSPTHVHNWFCTTYYNPLSNWFSHNCNDDSLTETRSVRLNFHWPEASGTPCNDPYIRIYAPQWFE